MEQTLNALQKQYRRLRISVFGFIPLLALAVACAFFDRRLTLALLAAAVAYQLLWLRPLQNRYTAAAARANLLQTVGRRLGTEELFEKSGGGITEADITAAELIPHDAGPGGCLLRQGVQGRLGGYEAAVCDATLGESFQLVKNGKRRVHFTSGCWVRITLPADTGADWRLLHKDAVPTPIRQEFYAARPLLDPADPPAGCPEGFLYYKGAGPAPGPRALAQLAKLAGYTPGQPALSLRGNTLTIFIRGRFVSRAVSLKGAPTAEFLGFDPLPELDYLHKLAGAVQLDTQAGDIPKS